MNTVYEIYDYSCTFYSVQIQDMGPDSETIDPLNWLIWVKLYHMYDIYTSYNLKKVTEKSRTIEPWQLEVLFSIYEYMLCSLYIQTQRTGGII